MGCELFYRTIIIFIDGVGSEKELDLKLYAKNLVILILAPGTDEGGVMVVSTKPRYSADAPSLAFKKNFEPSLQGESAGCLSLNTMHPLP